VRLDRELGRQPAGQAELHAIKPPLIGTDEILAPAVGHTVLAKIYSAVADHDLGGHDLQAVRAETLRRTEKTVIP
jgi:hypothetical protein